MRLESVNEDTTSYLTVTFLDKDGVPAIPSTAQYRVDCETTGRQVKGWTSISSPGATEEITLTPSENAILDGGNEKEIRAVQVTASYGAADNFHGEYRYEVTNLREPVTPIIYRGDDGDADESRALVFTGGAGWPDLTGATSIKLNMSFRKQTVVWTGTAPTPDGFNKVVQFEYTAAQSSSLSVGAYEFTLSATLSNGRTVTVKHGKIQVK